MNTHLIYFIVYIVDLLKNGGRWKSYFVLILKLDLNGTILVIFVFDFTPFEYKTVFRVIFLEFVDCLLEKPKFV